MTQVFSDEGQSSETLDRPELARLLDVGRLMTNIVAAASEFQQDLTRERMAAMRAAYKR